MTQDVTQADKITFDEFTAIFGGEIPMDAISLVWNAPADRTVAEIRAELNQMAADRLASTPAPDAEPFAWADGVIWHAPAHRAVMASIALGSWLSAALDDPKVCEAMKADIREWFSAGEPMQVLCAALAHYAQPAPDAEPVATVRTHDDPTTWIDEMTKKMLADMAISYRQQCVDKVARIEALEAALRANSAQLHKVFQAPEHTGKLSWVDDTAEALSEAHAALGDKHD